MARRKVGFWFRVAVVAIKPSMTLLTKRNWQERQRIPPAGGIILCVNHISYFDPLAVAHYVYDSERLPRFLAKAELFRIRIFGRLLAGTGQIPVYRDSRNAALAFRDAVAAVERGGCIIVYPEGTVTRDPGLWPMTGKSGAARIALLTGARVIPVAQWGAHEVLSPYSKRLRFFPRKTMRLRAGPSVDLSAFQGKELTPEVLRRATDAIMAAVTEQLESLRGEKAPAERYDMRTAQHRTPAPGRRGRLRRGDAGTWSTRRTRRTGADPGANRSRRTA